MENARRYEMEGLTLEIPVHYDQQAQMYIEDYPDFIENPVWTPQGHRVLFSGTDACSLAEEASPGGCPDCGSCIHFHRPCPHTWIGLCQHPKRRQK